MAAEQIELRMAVPVCAWCRRKGDPSGTESGEISHGICPRHRKKLEAEMHRLMGDKSSPPVTAVKRFSQNEPNGEPFLPLDIDFEMETRTDGAASHRPHAYI